MTSATPMCLHGSRCRYVAPVRASHRSSVALQQDLKNRHESQAPQKAGDRYGVLLYDKLPFGCLPRAFWLKRAIVRRILFGRGTGAKPLKLAEADGRGGDNGAGNAHPQELAPDYIEPAGAEE